VLGSDLLAFDVQLAKFFGLRFWLDFLHSFRKLFWSRSVSLLVKSMELFPGNFANVFQVSKGFYLVHLEGMYLPNVPARAPHFVPVFLRDFRREIDGF
jgi:hypothetical protein